MIRLCKFLRTNIFCQSKIRTQKKQKNLFSRVFREKNTYKLQNFTSDNNYDDVNLVILIQNTVINGREIFFTPGIGHAGCRYFTKFCISPYRCFIVITCHEESQNSRNCESQWIHYMLINNISWNCFIHILSDALITIIRELTIFLLRDRKNLRKSSMATIDIKTKQWSSIK